MEIIKDNGQCWPRNLGPPILEFQMLNLDLSYQAIRLAFTRMVFLGLLILIRSQGDIKEREKNDLKGGERREHIR